MSSCHKSLLRDSAVSLVTSRLLITGDDSANLTVQVSSLGRYFHAATINTPAHNLATMDYYWTDSINRVENK